MSTKHFSCIVGAIVWGAFQGRLDETSNDDITSRGAGSETRGVCTGWDDGIVGLSLAVMMGKTWKGEVSFLQSSAGFIDRIENSINLACSFPLAKGARFRGLSLQKVGASWSRSRAAVTTMRRCARRYCLRLLRWAYVYGSEPCQRMFADVEERRGGWSA